MADADAGAFGDRRAVRIERRAGGEPRIVIPLELGLGPAEAALSLAPEDFHRLLADGMSLLHEWPDIRERLGLTTCRHCGSVIERGR